MLRTKQLGTLSQCTRSFFLSGSRSNTADGNPSCTEDEPCISKKPTNSSAVLPACSTIVSNSLENKPVGQGRPGSGGTSASDENGSAVFRRSIKLEGTSAIAEASNDPGYCSMTVTDQFVKAGVATVTFLSDMINYKLPRANATVVCMPQSSVLDSRPLYNKSSSHSSPHSKTSFNRVNFTASIAEEYFSNSIESNDLGRKINGSDSGRIGGTQYVSNTKGNSSKNVKPHSRSRFKNPKSDTQGSKLHDSARNYHWVPTANTSNSTCSQSSSSVTDNIRKCIVQRARDLPQSASSPKEVYSRQPDIYNHTKDPKLVKSIKNKVSKSKDAERIYRVDQVYQILQNTKWSHSTEVALTHCCHHFDAYQANQVLKRLQDHYIALNFFYWLKHQPGFKHDEHSYTTMIGILGRAQQFNTIRNIFIEMGGEGCHPNVVTYNRLIHSYGRANYINEAINVFHQMQRQGCTPDRVTYCTLIDIHAKAGFLDGAMRIYRKMQEAGITPDTFTYSVIIHCLGKAGNLSSAYNIFCEMISHGCTPSLVTYNIILALQAKSKNFTNVFKLYKDMQNAGYSPDRVTYSIVMDVLGHCGHLDAAETLCAEMKENGCTPDEPVYGLLVDMWGKAGNIERARGWYMDMLESGLKPNVPTCNSLLSAYLRAHRFSDAYNMVQGMLQLGLSPSMQTYTLLLSCCTGTMHHSEMVFCCELMAITGHPAHVFLVTLPAAGPDGKNVKDHAGCFLDLMHGEDRESKRGLLDAIIDFLHKSGLKEEAGSVWEVAAFRNMYPDAVREKSTCHWLINLHVMSDGTAVTALSRTLAWFHRRLLASGIAPARIDIVTGWGRRSRVTGSSLVQQAVWDLLNIFEFPFSTLSKNNGCFVGCGEPLNSWLLHPYIERMHLL